MQVPFFEVEFCRPVPLFASIPLTDLDKVLTSQLVACVKLQRLEEKLLGPRFVSGFQFDDSKIGQDLVFERRGGSKAVFVAFPGPVVDPLVHVYVAQVEMDFGYLVVDPQRLLVLFNGPAVIFSEGQQPAQLEISFEIPGFQTDRFIQQFFSICRVRAEL